jgi:integrase
MATIFKRGGKGKRGGRYYISYFDHKGKRQSRSSRTTDKATAERIAAKLEADAALRRDGVVDPELDAICDQSRRSVESHVKDYEAKMRAANLASQHISTTIAYIRTICKDRKFEKVADITSDGVHQYAGSLKDQGRSTRTIQAYLTAIKGFTKWLAAQYKLPRDPLASVKKPNPKADRRRERRMLLPAEWQWVRATLAEGAERYEMPAEERMLLYAVAIQTGLRSSELRSLTRGRLFLDGNEPFITCKAGSTKNRQDARQYIQPALAALLREHIATKAPQASVFGMPPRSDVAGMFRADVADARLAWLKAAKQDSEEHLRRVESDFLGEKNHEGEFLDFHSLRHTCGAWLAMTGAHPKAVQSVMRHSTITLTMDTYGHLFPGQDAATVARLPNMMGSEPIALRATGTDGPAAFRLPLKDGDFAPGSARKSAAHAQQLGRDLVPDHATGCDGEAPPPRNGTSPNSLRVAGLCGSVRNYAKRRARDSNPQPVARHLISSLDEDPKNPEKSSVSSTSAAQGAALSPETPSADPQLTSVINAWPTLPSAIRGSILAIIQATGVRNA